MSAIGPTVLLAAAAAALAVAGAAELGATRRPRRRARLGLVLLTRIGRGLGRRPPRDLADRVAAAGIDLSVADVGAVKRGAALVAALVALPFLGDLPGRLPFVALVAVPAGAFFAPDLWLLRRARARARAMEAELGDVLTLLRVSVAAGLTPARALAEVGRRHPGVLAGELRRASARLALGEPQAVVLDGLGRRCPAAGVPALVAALSRAHRHGAPLAGALAAQAAEARARRAQHTAEAAARAAPKIQLVVALLLVPAVLLLVAAALLPALA